MQLTFFHVLNNSTRYFKTQIKMEHLRQQTFYQQTNKIFSTVSSFQNTESSKDDLVSRNDQRCEIVTIADYQREAAHFSIEVRTKVHWGRIFPEITLLIFTQFKYGMHILKHFKKIQDENLNFKEIFFPNVWRDCSAGRNHRGVNRI